MRRPLLLLSALACFGGAGITTVSAETVPGSGLYGYTLTANATGLQANEDEPSANSHPEGEGDVPQSLVSLTSGPVGYALSSVAWPGALGGNAGSLILLVKPDAPQQVKLLNDPVRAEARTGEGASDVANDTVPGAHMAAKATAGLVTADALVNGGDAGTMFGFGTTTTSARAVLGPDTATSTADSTAKDVDLAAGSVHIGSVVSHAEGHTDGTTATGKGKTTVNGLTIGGVPVVVDDTGVTVDTQHQGIDPVANSTVNSVLTTFGMTIVLSQPTVTRVGGSITYDAGSLIVNWKPPGSVNVFTAHLGGARVVAAATPASAALPQVQQPQQPGFSAPPVLAGIDPPSLVAPQQPLVLTTADPAAPQTAAPQRPTLQSAQERLLDGSPVPLSAVLFTALGAALLVGGLWRIPAAVLLDEAPVRCPLEENP